MSEEKSRIKTGDKISVITGKSKGMTGTVLRVLKKKSKPKSGFFVVVEGVNIAKKTVKPNPQKETAGGIISKEMPLPISNVVLIDPTTGKPGGKLGYKILEDGQKVRVFKKTGEVIHA